MEKEHIDFRKEFEEFKKELENSKPIFDDDSIEFNDFDNLLSNDDFNTFDELDESNKTFDYKIETAEKNETLKNKNEIIIGEEDEIEVAKKYLPSSLT